MATPWTLEELGFLKQLEVELDPDEQPQRLVFAHPRVVKYADEVIPALQTDGYIAGAASPDEQYDSLLYQFISGAPRFSMAPNCLNPSIEGVWELRSHDLRLFGWFWRPCVYIMSSIEQAARCKDLGLYHGHKEQARHFRDSIDLDVPKFITGGIDDVL